ncbi:MAG: PBP1A family penicillin-binding protein [Elusimicrobia bacterium]|nr:PBP1A family penicillin-binding protein [Elusimicrobiota bacterium]
MPKATQALRLARWLLLLVGLALLGPLALSSYAWVSYLSLERSITAKMDQYWLNITNPGREEYLLEEDESFEIPYLASKLSLSAEPTRILDARRRLIGEFSSEKGIYARDPDELPGFLKKALVASEDGSFYEHHGVNFRAIGRAMVVNLQHLSIRQGGSTLTQQLAKVMFTTRRKTYGRKIFEAFCARKLESKFTKDQILLMYLDFAYFGHGCFGVESAARFYFGKPARDLDLAESALLVALIPNPRRYSPFDNQELAAARLRTVLSRMVKLGFVPATTAGRTAEDFWKDSEARFRNPETSFWKMNVNKSPYLVEVVRRSLEKQFSKERIIKGGLRVKTTFDLDLQAAAQSALAAGLRAEDAVALSTSPSGKGSLKPSGGQAPADQAEVKKPPVEGALVALRPSDGALLALVGGRGFAFSNQLNRATDITRPIGSSVKPFIFAQAFESGRASPDDVYDDKRLSFKLEGGRRWEPANYGNKYFGKIALREALAKSLNSVAIQLLQKADIDGVIKLLSEATGQPAAKFPRNLSLALGTGDLSPVTVSRAYAALANGGMTVEPYFIESIEDRNGAVLRPGGPPAPPRRILSEAVCSTMRGLMTGVFLPGGTAHAAAAAAGFTMPAIGKTGTTNDYRDAWFAGATPDIAAAVWVGHDDMRVPLGYGRTGGNAAAPAWMAFLKEAYRHRPTRQFDSPASQ